MKILPQHIAIIMDGNGRWAERRMLPRVTGHHRGVESARAVVKHCVEQNIPILTLFAFSSENWQRPMTEVKFLMNILQKLLFEELELLNTNNVKLRVIGDIEPLSPTLRAAIVDAELATKNNSGLKLNIALNYGGRWDIVQATRAVCEAVKAQDFTVADITENLFSRYLTLSDFPEPDLLIRTSGEQRISNFLLWQLAYTEIYFSQVLWPDFTTADLDKALDFFAQRNRRFGLVTPTLEQVDHV
jgi:undecaprenyl diphosphate synthase